MSRPTASCQRVIAPRIAVSGTAARDGAGSYGYAYADAVRGRYAAPADQSDRFGRALTGDVLVATSQENQA
ncbi:MAG: hypothetical protein ACE5E6_02525 [Phycisphaerae bacterium]